MTVAQPTMVSTRLEAGLALLGRALSGALRAARPNWCCVDCGKVASALSAAGLRHRTEFGSDQAWLEYLEREVSAYEERHPQQPRAVCADEAQLRSWQERWQLHRQLQRGLFQGRK